MNRLLLTLCIVLAAATGMNAQTRLQLNNEAPGGGYGASFIILPPLTPTTGTVELRFPTTSGTALIEDNSGITNLTSLNASGPSSFGSSVNIDGGLTIQHNVANDSVTRTLGLRFQNDPYGGGGDYAGLRMYNRNNTEDMVLELYSGNDGGDRINFSVSDGTYGVMVNHYPVITTNNASTLLGSSLAGSYWSLGGNTTGTVRTLGSNDNYAVAFETNGTERMRLDTDGDLGIGTTNPRTPLHVARAASGATTYITLMNSAAAGTLNSAVQISFSNDVGAIETVPNTFIRSQNTGGANNAGTLSFGTYDGGAVATRMSIDPSGDVTIHTGEFIVDDNNTSADGQVEIEMFSASNYGWVYGRNAELRIGTGVAAYPVTVDPGNTGNPVLRIDQNIVSVMDGANPAIRLQPNGTMSLFGTSASTGAVLFYEPQAGGASYITLKAPALATSYDLVLPADDGGSGQFLQTDGSGNLAWATVGLQYFTETRNTTAPNATVPVHQIIASGTETDIDMALRPKGTGALTADAADGTSTGGNKRGLRAVDFQRSRTSNSQVASGERSVIGGGVSNTASGLGAVVVGGLDNIASGGGSFIGAGTQNTASNSFASVLGGRNNTASGYGSAVVGGTSMTVSGLFSFGFNASDISGGGQYYPITVSSNQTATFANADLWLANTRNQASELRFYEAQSTTGTFPAAGTNYTAFKAQAQAADITYTLPASAPTAGQALIAGSTPTTLEWGAAGATNLDGLSDAKSGGTDFSNSLLLGHQSVGGISGADQNTAVGIATIQNITTGDYNTALGYAALQSITTGAQNTALGANAMPKISTSSFNVAVGMDAMSDATTTGIYNTVVGTQAGFNLDGTAAENTAIGGRIFRNATTGSGNTAVGFDAMYNGGSGTGNTAIGKNALRSLTTGGTNVAVGLGAGASVATGTGNVFLGYQAGNGETGSDKLYIDNSSTATPLIYGDFSSNNLTVNGALTLEAGTTTYGSGVDAGNLSNTYIAFGAAGATSDWSYLRQIGSADQYHVVWDFHDNSDDARFSIRSVGSSGATPDVITTRLSLDGSGNLTIGGIGYFNRASATEGGEIELQTSGNTAQVWVLDEFSGNNEARFRLYPSSSGELYGLCIEENDGHVGIGTNNPIVPLHVYRAADSAFFRIENSLSSLGISLADNFNVANWGASASDYGSNFGTPVIVLNSPNTTSFVFGDHVGPWSDNDYDLGHSFARWRNIYAGNNVIQTSDYRLKDDLRAFEALPLVRRIPVYDYVWKSSGQRQYGFMAHELQEVVPYLVMGTKDAVDSKGNPVYQGLDYSKLTPILTKAIQEQQAVIESQEQRIQKLEALVQELLERK